ncbi:MAG: hypothetical protein HRT89_00005 [Lentisphaeria bacterium]|nr:hypothetical protein [Lentisphaeria bacterium]NQZ66425.1 hypothetical protein [Lentisphaeria bacterium]
MKTCVICNKEQQPVEVVYGFRAGICKDCWINYYKGQPYLHDPSFKRMRYPDHNHVAERDQRWRYRKDTDPPLKCIICKEDREKEDLDGEVPDVCSACNAILKSYNSPWFADCDRHRLEIFYRFPDPLYYSKDSLCPDCNSALDSSNQFMETLIFCNDCNALVQVEAK